MSMNFKIVENVFADDTIQRLYKTSRDGRAPSGVNFFNFIPELVGISNAVFRFDLDNDLRSVVAKELIEKEMLASEPKKWQAYIHLFTRESFLPWHDDKGYVHTVTVYLNPMWEYNWGGAFMYMPGPDDIRAMYPKFNTGVCFDPPMLHCPSITAGNAPMRESLQIFVEEY